MHVLIYCCVAIPDRIRDITLRIIIITSVIISLISHFANKKALAKFDMYPLYWTTSKGGIFMRYSYEFKRKAIELFYQGEWPKTPKGVRTDTFHRQIRDWVKLERLHGSDINKCRGTNKYWSPKEKFELVCQVLSGQGLRAVAIEEYINYYNNRRIQKKTKWMPPVKYREASMCLG